MKKQRLLLTLALTIVLAFGGAIAVGAAPVTPQNPAEALSADVSDNRIEFVTPDYVPGGEPVVPQEPEIPWNPDPGSPGPEVLPNTAPLRLETVPVFDFDEHASTVTLRTFNAILPFGTLEGEAVTLEHGVQIGDFRNSGAGWSLYATLTEQFSGTHAVAGAVTLTGATVTLSNIAAATYNEEMPAVAPSPYNLASSVTLNYTVAGASHRIATAEELQGMGRTFVRFGTVDEYGTAVADGRGNADESVQLTIPREVQIWNTEYTGTILWTLTNAPTTN